MNRLWQRLADFLHQANLIPLVVVVSGYHYYQALRSHDPFLVALPMALFVDLLHYRTVQRAVRVGRLAWQLAALLTTAMAYGLQWIFYSQPATGSGALPGWQVVLFAGLVPFGLAIMAWHHEAQARDRTTDWQEQAEAARAQAVQLEKVAAAAEETARRALAEAQEANQARQRLEREAVQIQEELAKSRATAADAQAQKDTLAQSLAEAQPALQAWQAMNRRAQVAAQVHAGQLDLQAAAAAIGMSPDTVRRDVARLDGRK